MNGHCQMSIYEQALSMNMDEQELLNEHGQALLNEHRWTDIAK